jgi:hypothetical protein
MGLSVSIRFRRETSSRQEVTYRDVFNASNLDELNDKIVEHEIKRMLMQDLENINEDLLKNPTIRFLAN